MAGPVLKSSAMAVVEASGRFGHRLGKEPAPGVQLRGQRVRGRRANTEPGAPGSAAGPSSAGACSSAPATGDAVLGHEPPQFPTAIRQPPPAPAGVLKASSENSRGLR